MIYISLNGLNKLDWITEQVILARLSPTKSANVAYGLVKSAFEVAGHIPVKGKLIQQSAFVASKQLRDNATNLFDFHNCVIVFDDLERIDPSLKIETVLGYINTNFIEHNYNKVILVADKEKISGKFNEVQEKFIDRIVKFEHDLESTIIDYIKSFLTIKSKYAGALKYIERDKDEILRMINIAQCKNLRTIRFVFELFSTVFETTKLTRMNDQMARAMFMFTLTISNEFKKGILPVRDKKYDLNELREIYSIFIKIRKVNDDSELNYSGVFCKKYLYNVNVEWKFFKSILDFIVNGTFDQDLFNKEMDYYTKQKEEWDQSLDDFFNYYNLELDRLSAISKKVLNYASYGKYTPSQYLAIYSNLQEHIAKEYIQLPIDYKEKLKTGLELSLKNHPDTFSMVNEFSNQYATSTYGNDPDFDEIFDTERSKYIQKVKENNINEFFNALNDPNNNFFSTPIWKKIDQNPEFFQSIPTESFVENIVVLKNKNIRLLTSIINQRFMRISNAGQYYYNLKPIFDGFANGLEIKLQNITVDKLKLDILKEVVEALKKCSEHLENSRGGKPL